MIQDFRLTVFVTVARVLSFTRASVLLNVSQPAISKHIKELEVEFGEALFSRQGNRISLTQKGREVLPLAELILESYYPLNDAISTQENSFEGVIHVGASTTIAQYLLPEILAKFNRAYPRIRLSVVSANSEEVIRLLERKEIELAIIEGDSSSSAVHYADFVSDEIVLVSRKGRGKVLSSSDVEQLPLVIREEGSGTLSVVVNALRGRGVSRKGLDVRMQLGSSEAIIRYLKASDCYAFLSILVVAEHLAAGTLRRVELADLEILRTLRFATLHGQNGRLVTIFQEFCMGSVG
ncbi:MAG: LysR substrate-binding domain-containing protein [Rikenellaceae bacterium]